MAHPIRTKSKREPRPRRETELSTRITTWRKLKVLSQSALAQAADVTVSSISHYESGRIEPSHDHLVAIVTKGLGISMARFYGRLPELPKAAA